ncbi:alpha/beta fold hydrolase [Pseudomonas sp. dw_358]|uniref:alpha/beta fold hydrolase n=1 Tax=Pseudomonas sp. dw_358 TaxID=2720083 RepID=UPI001BD26525|nr:alpha/beta fold hydrolase [Pseudomonas sp. dw_358]
MRPEIAVLDIQGQYRVYTELYRAEAAEKTIILVNGSLATTASFAQTVRSLHPEFNVVLYDQPYSGKSKAHNHNQRSVTKEEEGLILLELIDHFNAEQIMSFSWGGACAMLALAHRPKRIEKAVISSFSPVLNAPMRDYLERGAEYLGAFERFKIGHLVNDTIGKHLPSLFKRFNYKHVSSLEHHEYMQMHFHISEVLANELGDALTGAGKVNVPVLFINGEWDEYTTHQEARIFANHVEKAQFACIQNTGHFLDMEHKVACQDTRNAMIDFLQPHAGDRRLRYRPAQNHPALAF